MSLFKLLAGQHVGPDMSCEPDAKGKRPSKTFKQGEAVESDVDLVDKFGFEKFMLIQSPVHRHAPPLPSSVATALSPGSSPEENPEPPRNNAEMLASLGKLTVAQLKELAADEEVDISGVNQKDEIIKILRVKLGNK